MFQRTGSKGYPVLILSLIGALVAGCGKTSGAADLVLGRSTSQIIGPAGGKIQSLDGQAEWVVPAGEGGQEVAIALLDHLPAGLSGHIGQAYRVEAHRPDMNAIFAIRYDETTLPLGEDEADLTLGKMVGNRWEGVWGAIVDVVDNRVTGPVLSSNSIDVYALLMRPHPKFFNASFDGAMAGGVPEGWKFNAKSPRAGGKRHIKENNLFLIQDQGQADSDPSIRQVIHGFTPGRNYVITGLFSGYGDCCENTEVLSFGVAVDGRMILERSRPLGDGLVPFAATLQATAKSHEISFLAERNGSHLAYLIDNLTITPERGIRLAVASAGSGKGIVISRPAGIYCGETCSASFASGHPVTLVASAAPGSAFIGFGQEECAGMSICTLTLDAAKTVTATFSNGSTRATLMRLITKSDRGYAEGRLEPDFNPQDRAYQVTRIEQPGFVMFVAETEDEGAVIRMGGRVVPSGQPLPFYFDGQDQAVSILVTAQDGQTVETYTVKLCRWYCVTPSKAGANTIL